MNVGITGAQRDALYDGLLDRLSGIEDIWIAASREDYETAERLGREYCDDLRLIMDDLGWGEGARAEEIKLTTPPEVLRRTFERLRDSVETERAAQAASWAESRTIEDRNRLAGEACASVLEALDGAA